MNGLGYAKAVDMEPDMHFRRALGQGVMVFAYVDPIVSRFDGKRRVRVTTAAGFRFVCDWDTRFVLVEYDR